MNKSITSYQPLDDEQSTRYLADHWPKGRLTANRQIKDSVMYKFIQSISIFVQIFLGYIFTLVRNRDIDQSEELLEEWETSVKIPQDVPRRSTIAARQGAVKRLISKVPVYNEFGTGTTDPTTIGNYLTTLSGFVGLTVQTLAETSGATGSTTDYFYFIIGVPATYGELNNFPFSFPIPFGSGRISQYIIEILNILTKRILPAFCRWQVIIIP